MNHARWALEFGQRWGWVLFIACMFVLYAWRAAWIRRGEEYVRVTVMTGRRIRVALVFLCFGFIFALPSKSMIVATTSVAGTLLGTYVGWRDTGKRELQLRSEGRLSALTNPVTRRPSFTELRGFLTILVVILCAQALGGSRLRGVIELLALVTMGLGAGYFLSVSVYVWLWAKRKESQGFKPLVIPISRR
jgi:hypothetical protein